MSPKTRHKNIWNLPKFNTPAGLEEYRTWLTNLLMLFVVIVFPIVVVFSGSIFFQEEMYFLIILDAIIYFIISLIFFLKKESMPILSYIWLLLLYTILITFFVALGPHYIWAAWMVMAAVMAAFLFGLRGAVFAVILNILILIALYFTIDANNLAWANVFAEPFGKWVIFIINVSLITIVSTFPVAFLLKRLDISLKHEKNATETLSKETMELKKTIKRLKNIQKI
ncbi:MAG: hypothetical protein RBR53_07895 [Desulforegulaceae bacterium]|nr:hypothetical protein [Desulforegulaceae bacterium]